MIISFIYNLTDYYLNRPHIDIYELNY